MSKFDRKSRSNSKEYASYGHGAFIQRWPGREERTFADFRGGLNLTHLPEGIPDNSSPDTMNMEVEARNRLTRAPGTETIEVLGERTPVQMAVQPHLTHISELVLFDPPYIGVWRTGAIAWYDVGLWDAATRRVRHTVFGERLVFTDGRAVYTRDPHATEVEELEDAPVADSYASFAGRVVAGGAVMDGQHEPLSMVWSAASGFVTDWYGLGGGFELLIDDVSAGDGIVALRSLGFDQLAILMRNSIWIGKRTGLLNRPIDFQPRVPKIGAVNEATCRVTPNGVVFLSRQGVQLFDGNSARMLSEAINPELLDVDLDRLDEYHAAYHPKEQKYHLYTPGATYTYDLQHEHWLRRSMRAEAAVPMAQQSEYIIWDEALGNWEDADWMGVSWIDLLPAEELDIDMLVIGGTPSVLARTVRGAETIFGEHFEPLWTVPFTRTEDLAHLITLISLHYVYWGSGTMEFQGICEDTSAFALSRDTVEGSEVPKLVELATNYSGRGMYVALRYLSGDPLVNRLYLEGEVRSRRVIPGRPEARTRFDVMP